MYDIHSHVLPGLDDGAKTLEDAVELCRMAAADGVRAIVATPHIREGVWPNRRERILPALEELRQELTRRSVAIEVLLGAEIYFSSEVYAAIGEGAFPTYGDGRRYFLLELPNYFILRQAQRLVFDFRTAGLTPVLAHPERNPQLMGNLLGLEELVRMGALVQVTAMSVTGRFGRAARRAAETLLERGLVHVVASDGHHPSLRPTLLRAAYDRIAARHGEQRARRLLVDNPRAIVEGGEVEGGLLEPAPPGALRRLLARVLGAPAG
jgi:protein-tyrosine phosphatase